MNFSRDSIRNILEDIEYGDSRKANRRAHSVRSVAVFLALFACVAVVSFGFGAVTGIIENSPEVTELEFSPTGYASHTYDINGNVVATLVQAGSNRQEASFSEMPENLVNAFVAIEDQRFWEHNGIDLRSITRAAKGVLTGNSSQGGGSTITQQLIKNNVFGGGNEKGFALYERKFQEWYIALSLENQPGKSKRKIKEQILEDYLNTINLGSNTLGVRVAARKYFDKELEDLTLAECAALAAIPKNPSRLNPLTHPEDNQDRRLEVLKKMEAQGYITAAQRAAASSKEIYSEIKRVNEERKNSSAEIYSYFTDELISQCIKALKQELGMTEAEAKKLLYSGGLQIYTTQDPAIQKIVDEEVNNPDNYDTAKYSIKWKVTLKKGQEENISYNEKDVIAYVREQIPEFNGLFLSRDSASAYVEEFRKTVIGDDDEVLSESLDLILQPQVSFVVLDQKTGEVKAITGGRGEKEYSLTTNRATGSCRQPGSTFKVITSFAPALEEKGKTLGSAYYDSIYKVGEKEFRNWWQYGQYFGWSNIREGIEFSMNVVAVRCLVEDVSPEDGVDFAQRLGITTLEEEDKSGALALGGLTRGVTNLELTNAFSAIANGGVFEEYKLFTKICDRNGNLLVDNTGDRGSRVMRETTAYLLTDAMRMSTVAHTKFSSDFTVNNTSSRCHLENMICAGKSGTTTANRDIWFVGFTPYYTAGVWGGCDENQTLYDSSTGEYNGGTSFHNDIWNKIMTRIHEGKEDPGAFEKPDGLVTAEICRKSGLLATDSCRLDVRNGQTPVYEEYFERDTVPTATCTCHTEDGSVTVSEEDLARGETDDTKVNAAKAQLAAEEDPVSFIAPDAAESLGPGVFPRLNIGSNGAENYDR